MAQFASDTFTGTSGTELAAYNSAWAKHSTATGNAIITSANRVRQSTATARYIHSGAPASADYTVTADIYCASQLANSTAGVIGRADAAAATFYSARIALGSGTTATLQLFKTIAGTAAQLGSNVSITLAAGNSASLQLEMIGSAIKVYVDGLQKISQTNSEITAAGKAGITYLNSSTDTTGAHLDNFSADDIGAGGSNSITLNDYTTGRIFQRNGTTGKIPISGTFTGTPTSIQARIVQDGTSTEVVTWTTIDSAPVGVSFSALLSSVPQGGWYNVQVRFGNDTGTVSNGTAKVGVGLLYAVIGQSQGTNWFSVGTDIAADSLTRKYSGHAGTGWAVLGTGNGATNFAKTVRTAVGSIPVGILSYAASNTALDQTADSGSGYWLNTTADALYDLFKQGFNSIKVSGEPALEGVIWLQGEKDASAGITGTTYQTDLETLLARIRTDTGQSTLQAFICSLNRNTAGIATDANWQAIQDALRTVAEEGNNWYASHTLDLALTDGTHLTAASYTTQSTRVAQSALHQLGEESYSRGPFVASAIIVSPSIIDVTLTHRGGTDFTPTSGITGFVVKDGGGNVVTISSADQTSPTVIRLTLAASLPGAATVTYDYGAAPTITGAVKDNSAVALPLEFYSIDTSAPPPATGGGSRSVGGSIVAIKQLTATNLPVFMVASSDHFTGKTGATLAVSASKNGAAFASITPTVTELGNGWYNLALTTTHTNTLGVLLLHITATGADPLDERHQVMLDLPGASVASVLGDVDGNVLGSVASVASVVNANVSKVNNVTVLGNGTSVPMHG